MTMKFGNLVLIRLRKSWKSRQLFFPPARPRLTSQLCCEIIQVSWDGCSVLLTRAYILLVDEVIHPYAKYNFAKFFGMADVKQEKTLRINDNIQVQLSLELFKSGYTELEKAVQQIQFVFQPTCLLSHPLSVSSHTEKSIYIRTGWFQLFGSPME